LRQPSLQLVGTPTSETLDLPALRDRGIRLVGRVLSAQAHDLRLSTDLPREVIEAELRRNKVLDRIDTYVRTNELDASDAGMARRPVPSIATAPDRLNLRREGISTVVWATGFRRAYPWLKVPVFGAGGEIVNRDGVTAAPGLFTIGLPFMRHRSSTFIDGVGRDADALAQDIAAYLEKTAASAA
jgi:putative flavoprotein involved in K+ transport